jgi:predicted aspartyl protease
MPVYSYKSPNLEKDGSIIEVSIYPSLPVGQDLRSKNLPVPSKRLKGLIDTGASCTAFNSPIASELGLLVRDKQKVLTPAGQTEQYLYDIVIFLGGSKILMTLQALGADLKNQPYEILLGRDVLKACTLIYNGWDDSYDIHVHEDRI